MDYLIKKNPLANIDTRPFESAVGTAYEVVTDRFSEVADTVGERLHDDVIPLVERGASQTRTFVRTQRRVSMAGAAGVALLVLLIVWIRRRGDDDAGEAAGEDDSRPRSVA